MNNAIYTSKLIDERNEDLFETVSSVFDISFEPSYNGEHSVYTQGKQMIFYIPVGEYCIDSFSHELLHGYLDYYGVNLTGSFKNAMQTSNVLSRIFDTGLSEHIANSITHTLMLPIFLERGFERSKFILDYDTFKCEPGFMGKLARFYKQGNEYDCSAVRNFIGKYFAFKCDPNPEFDYQEQLNQLKKIDQQLYRILDLYFSLWADYDFMDDEAGEFRLNNLKLYHELKPWMSGKKFA